MLRSLLPFLMLFLTARVGFAQMPPPSPANLALQVEKTLECSKPEAERSTQARAQRHWCALTFVGRGEFFPPGKRRVLLGLSINLKGGQDILSALRATPELAALTIDQKGALVAAITPGDTIDKKSYMAAMASLMLVLKRKETEVHASKKLANYFKELEQEKLHPFLGRTGLFEGLLNSRVFSVRGVFGEGYVVIEDDEQSQRLNLFPLAPLAIDETK